MSSNDLADDASPGLKVPELERIAKLEVDLQCLDAELELKEHELITWEDELVQMKRGNYLKYRAALSTFAWSRFGRSRSLPPSTKRPGSSTGLACIVEAEEAGAVWSALVPLAKVVCSEACTLRNSWRQLQGQVVAGDALVQCEIPRCESTTAVRTEATECHASERTATCARAQVREGQLGRFGCSFEPAVLESRSRECSNNIHPSRRTRSHDALSRDRTPERQPARESSPRSDADVEVEVLDVPPSSVGKGEGEPPLHRIERTGGRFGKSSSQDAGGKPPLIRPLMHLSDHTSGRCSTIFPWKNDSQQDARQPVRTFSGRVAVVQRATQQARSAPRGSSARDQQHDFQGCKPVLRLRPRTAAGTTNLSLPSFHQDAQCDAQLQCGKLQGTQSARGSTKCNVQDSVLKSVDIIGRAPLPIQPSQHVASAALAGEDKSVCRPVAVLPREAHSVPRAPWPRSPGVGSSAAADEHHLVSRAGTHQPSPVAWRVEQQAVPRASIRWYSPSVGSGALAEERNVVSRAGTRHPSPISWGAGQAVSRASLRQYSPLVLCAAVSDEHHSVSHAARRHTLQVAPRADDPSLHRGLLRPHCPVVDSGAVSEDKQSVSRASTRQPSPVAGCADKQVAPQDWSHPLSPSILPASMPDEQQSGVRVADPTWERCNVCGNVMTSQVMRLHRTQCGSLVGCAPSCSTSSSTPSLDAQPCSGLGQL
mmetsp:Transcript_8597/g.23942  ORF Transcript_8597/g.23942 Transcript_8597/m.23942 type:complete len:710 (-) Transcript_8597:63-2192(-)